MSGRTARVSSRAGNLYWQCIVSVCASILLSILLYHLLLQVVLLQSSLPSTISEKNISLSVSSQSFLSSSTIRLLSTVASAIPFLSSIIVLSISRLIVPETPSSILIYLRGSLSVGADSVCVSVLIPLLSVLLSVPISLLLDDTATVNTSLESYTAQIQRFSLLSQHEVNALHSQLQTAELSHIIIFLTQAIFNGPTVCAAVAFFHELYFRGFLFFFLTPLMRYFAPNMFSGSARHIFLKQESPQDVRNDINVGLYLVHSLCCGISGFWAVVTSSWIINQTSVFANVAEVEYLKIFLEVLHWVSFSPFLTIIAESTKSSLSTSFYVGCTWSMSQVPHLFLHGGSEWSVGSCSIPGTIANVLLAIFLHESLKKFLDVSGNVSTGTDGGFCPAFQVKDDVKKVQ